MKPLDNTLPQTSRESLVIFFSLPIYFLMTLNTPSRLVELFRQNAKLFVPPFKAIYQLLPDSNMELLDNKLPQTSREFIAIFFTLPIFFLNDHNTL